MAVLECRVGAIVVIMYFFTPDQFDRPAELATFQRQVAALPA